MGRDKWIERQREIVRDREIVREINRDNDRYIGIRG
mgnify:CR=1 FL=1